MSSCCPLNLHAPHSYMDQSSSVWGYSSLNSWILHGRKNQSHPPISRLLGFYIMPGASMGEGRREKWGRWSGWVDELMDGWVGGWIHRWVSGRWIGRWMDGIDVFHFMTQIFYAHFRDGRNWGSEETRVTTALPVRWWQDEGLSPHFSAPSLVYIRQKRNPGNKPSYHSLGFEIYHPSAFISTPFQVILS